VPGRGPKNVFGFGASKPHLQGIPEGSEAGGGVAVLPSIATLLPSRLGESVGDMLLQSLVGKSWNPMKIFEVAAYGAAIEAAAPGCGKRCPKTEGHSPWSHNGPMFWAPLLACAFVGGLELIQGRPEAVIDACQVRVF
jgi:hypothetical protein